MSTRKSKVPERVPDLTIDIGGLIVFADKPRGGLTRTSAGVVTCYDPAVTAMVEGMKQKSASPPKKRRSENGHSAAGEPRKERLTTLLDDCLREAESIKSKRGTELVKLLRDARRQVELIDPR